MTSTATTTTTTTTQTHKKYIFYFPIFLSRSIRKSGSTFKIRRALRPSPDSDLPKVSDSSNTNTSSNNKPAVSTGCLRHPCTRPHLHPTSRILTYIHTPVITRRPCSTGSHLATGPWSSSVFRPPPRLYLVLRKSFGHCYGLKCRHRPQ